MVCQWEWEMELQECGMSQPSPAALFCPPSLGRSAGYSLMSAFPPKKTRLMQMHPQLFVDDQPGVLQRRVVCPSLAGGIQCQRGRIVMAQLHPSAFPSDAFYFLCIPEGKSDCASSHTQWTALGGVSGSPSKVFLWISSTG